MVLHYGGTIDVFSAITLPTPTYSYAYKNATFDGLRGTQGVRDGEWKIEEREKDTTYTSSRSTA